MSQQPLLAFHGDETIKAALLKNPAQLIEVKPEEWPKPPLNCGGLLY